MFNFQRWHTITSNKKTCNQGKMLSFPIAGHPFVLFHIVSIKKQTNQTTFRPVSPIYPKARTNETRPIFTLSRCVPFRSDFFKFCGRGAIRDSFSPSLPLTPFGSALVVPIAVNVIHGYPYRKKTAKAPPPAPS
nr:MAG TPA: hypothetical protein [Caudoviricetes sp.]